MAPRSQKFILLVNFKQGTVRSVQRTPKTPPTTPVNSDNLKYCPDQVVESAIKLLDSIEKASSKKERSSSASKESASRKKRFLLRIVRKPHLKIEAFQV